MNRSGYKKISIVILRLLIFIVILEISARTYHCIKYRDPSVFLYGKNYFKNLISEIAETASVRTPASRSASTASDSADEVFESRKTRGIPIATQEPVRIVGFGQSMYFNHYGMRNAEIELKKDPGTIRIIAFGESFVMCPGVDDLSTWERLLSERLMSLPMEYEVINAGAGGHNIHHNLVTLIDKIAKFSPDYIIFFSAHNNHALLDYKKERSVA